MQTKRKYSWGYLALAVVVCGVLLVSWGNLRRKQRLSEPVELSVIVRWQSSEVWENIRRGIELAAQDYNLDVMYITLTDENSVQEQETMIGRETQLDTQAILLAAADQEALCQTVEETQKKIPVICFESGTVCPGDVMCISADNYAMGQELGKLLLTQGVEQGQVLLVGADSPCQSIQDRKAGVLSVLEDYPISTTVCSELGEESELTEYDAVLALDTQPLEDAAQRLEGHPQEVVLLGIGGNNRIAYHMEHNVIQGIVAQNEVGMGYLAAKQAADAVRTRASQEAPGIEYRVITKETMYERENEQLLFPFGL